MNVRVYTHSMSLRGLPRPLWVLFAATLINRAGWVVMPFLTLYLTRDLGLTPSQAGGTLALAGVAGIATSPIAGSLADRLGPRPIMLASMFLSAAILLGFPLVKSYLGVLAAAAALAASLELFRPANLAVVSQLLDEQQRPLGFSLMRLATSLGMSVGPAVSGVLVQTSFTLLFVVDAATTFAAATILLVAFRPAATLNHARPTLSSTDRSIVALLANERLRWFLLPVLLVMLVLSQHFSTVSLYLTRDLHLPASIYGLTFTVNMLLVATLQVPLTAATVAWPHRRTLRLGALALGIGFGALVLCHSALEVLGGVVVWTVGEMLLLPTMSARVADIAAPNRLGATMGLYSMTINLAFAAGPLAGTTMMAWAGSAALWATCFALGFTAAAMMGRGGERPLESRPRQGSVPE